MRSKMDFLPATTISAAVLAALATAQASSPGQGEQQDPGVRPERARDAQGMRELEEARMNLQSQVRMELNQRARELDQSIQSGHLVLSITDRGMIAGAPGSDMGSGGTQSPMEREQGQPGGLGDEGQDDGRNDPNRPGQPALVGAGQGAVEGVVLVTGDLVPNAPGVQPGQSPGVAAFEVRHERATNQVQLVTSTGQVAATFPLIDIEPAGRPIEGSARGTDLEGRDPVGATGDESRPREASAPREHARGVAANGQQWNRVYASVVCGLMKGQHGY